MSRARPAPHRPPPTRQQVCPQWTAARRQPPRTADRCRSRRAPGRSGGQTTRPAAAPGPHRGVPRPGPPIPGRAPRPGPGAPGHRLRWAARPSPAARRARLGSGPRPVRPRRSRGAARGRKQQDGARAGRAVPRTPTPHWRRGGLSAVPAQRAADRVPAGTWRSIGPGATAARRSASERARPACRTAATPRRRRPEPPSRPTMWCARAPPPAGRPGHRRARHRRPSTAPTAGCARRQSARPSRAPGRSG